MSASQQPKAEPAPAIIPKSLQIETVANACNARCPMCKIEEWTRPRKVMSTETFRTIIEKFVPYKDQLETLTLHGCGEALLDKKLHLKVKIAKDLGIPSVGFASNCDLLDEKRAQSLLDAGQDIIICSIDGIDKETHEAIRPGVDFDNVVANVERFIKMRDEGGHTTRVFIRMIRQQLNVDQWDEYQEYWNARVDLAKGDNIGYFNIHNWGGSHDDIDSKDVNVELDGKGEPIICSDVFERMLIYASGDFGFCCADDDGYFDIGNALTDDPIRLYNEDPNFLKYRAEMEAGRIGELEHCKNCTVYKSRLQRSY